MDTDTANQIIARHAAVWAADNDTPVTLDLVDEVTGYITNHYYTGTILEAAAVANPADVLELLSQK